MPNHTAIQEAVNRFHIKFDHINSRTDGGGRICDGTCDKEYTLDDVGLFLTTELTRIVALAREEACGVLEGMKETVRHHESCLNKEYGGTYCDCGHPEQWKSHNSALSTAQDLIRKLP